MSKISPTNFITAAARGRTNIPHAKEISKLIDADNEVKKFLANIRKSVPAETPDEKIISLPAYFESRYLGMKKAIQIMVDDGLNFFVEFACGFSTHNINTVKDFYNITFIASDLTEIITEKEKIDRRVAKKAIFNRLFFKAINILNYKDIKNGVNSVKDSGEIVFLAEGLLRYLNRQQQTVALNNISGLLSTRGGYLITHDFLSAVHTKKLNQENEAIIAAFSREVGTDLNSNGFDSEEAAKEFIDSCGFKMYSIKQVDNINELSEVPPPDEAKKVLEGKIWIMSLK